MVQQVLDHLCIALPSSAYRSPPQAARGLSAREAREWTYEPLEEDLPLPDPLAI